MPRKPSHVQRLGRAEQREYKSRKTRKKEKRARKGRGEDEVSAAFKEAQLGADAAQRRKTQSETLEALFEIFFRVLKHCTASGLASPTRTGAPRGSRRSVSAGRPVSDSGF